jgi:methionyl aminopeptidase
MQAQETLIKSPQQIADMRAACKIVASAMRTTLDAIEVSMSTFEVDTLIHDAIVKQGAKPAFLGLYGFPATACISINNEIVHGIPKKERLIEDGDLVSIDCGAIVDGMYSDMARTIVVGNATPAKENLIQSTKESLEDGIRQVAPGNRVGDISRAVEERLNSSGFGVVREYVGHGIGTALHEQPQIPNFAEPFSENLLMIGMTLAIEPMATTGAWQTAVLDDGWTVVTSDGSLSAHFEDTVLVTENGYEVLTRI